jgi:hypothetical protein
VPVIAIAIWERLSNVLPFHAKPSGMTMTRWDFRSHSRTRTVPGGGTKRFWSKAVKFLATTADCPSHQGGVRPNQSVTTPPAGSFTNPGFLGWTPAEAGHTLDKDSGGALSQASPMIAPIMADVKPLGIAGAQSGETAFRFPVA